MVFWCLLMLCDFNVYSLKITQIFNYYPQKFTTLFHFFPHTSYYLVLNITVQLVYLFSELKWFKRWSSSHIEINSEMLSATETTIISLNHHSTTFLNIAGHVLRNGGKGLCLANLYMLSSLATKPKH